MMPVLKIGLDSAAPFPMHIDLRSGVSEGFEVDLINFIAENLNVEIKYEVSLWKDILPQLYRGELDMICSTVTITPSRKHIMEFSDPYLKFHLCAVVKASDSLSAVEDFKDKVIGVRIAAVAENYMMQHFPGNLMVHAETNQELYEGLENGTIDVLIDDSPIAGGFLRKYKNLKVGMFMPNTESFYAIAMKKGDLKLKKEINRVLRLMKENGYYDVLFEKWFRYISL